MALPSVQGTRDQVVAAGEATNKQTQPHSILPVMYVTLLTILLGIVQLRLWLASCPVTMGAI